MSGYVINTSQVPIRALQGKSVLEKGDTGYFNIVSELDYLPIKKKNPFVLVKVANKEMFFINEGVITNVGEPTIIPPDLTTVLKSQNSTQPKPKYNHPYEYLIEKELKKNNALDDLKYSLKSVYNFNKPESHFHKQFRELITPDYNAIVNGWIYVLRTAFGKISNSIPRQNKLEFMLQAIEKFQTIDFTKVSLLDGIDFLDDYVNRRLLSRGRLLVATSNILNNNLSDLLEPNEVGFIDEESGNEKNISIQAEIFKKLFDLKQKTSIKEHITEAISKDPPLEEHFKKVFSKETWPIDLRV